ncbi:MAG: PIN domain-containing protein [Vicinamibacterales bacterium]
MTGTVSGRSCRHERHPASAQSQRSQHRSAREAIARLTKAGDRICVASQNLVELWAVCTRPVESNGLGLRPAQAERVISRVESLVFRLPDLDEIYSEWRRLVVVHEVSGKKTHDTRLVAAMIVHRVALVLTFNVDDFGRYPGITVIHPTGTQRD